MYQRKRPVVSSPVREIVATWDTFRGGLNTFSRQTELDKDELSQADNMLLTGRGIPTKRWGSEDYFLGGSTGYGRGIIPAKSAAGTIELLGLTDWGILTKKNGASYTAITGTSWPSGYNMEGAQLGNNVYLVSSGLEFTRYNFSTLTSFTTLAVPSGVAVSNFSGATGSTTWGWRVSSISNAGETLAATSISLASLPEVLSNTLIRLQWTPISAASGILKGYNIYRGHPGDETWLTSVDDATTIYFDTGTAAALLRTAPDADTSGGHKAKYIIRFEDRIIMAGITNYPTKVVISGRYPDQERFDWAGGGGYVHVDPDTGDFITGLGVHQGRIIVFKEKSIWEISLSTVKVGNNTILEPIYHLVTAAQGCSSHRSIVPVDNDLFFINGKGIYVLGLEANIQDSLRTNEISTKVRPFFESMSAADINSACGAYFDYKYLIAFPTAKKILVFDRERLAFMGPWVLPYGLAQMTSFTDSNSLENWLILDNDDTFISRFSKSLQDDKGTAFRTLLKTKKEDFGDWTLFKTINEMFTQFRNVFGSINVNIFLEEASGQTVTGSSFTITSQSGISGWGTDQWGLPMWGLSINNAAASSEDLIRRTKLFKTARTYQVELSTTAGIDSYELLGIKTTVTPQGKGHFPAETWDTN